MSTERQEKPSSQSSIGKKESLTKGIKEIFKGGRITSQAPPKPQKPKGK